jgi:GNAT superfamily N-acetyltransferase
MTVRVARPQEYDALGALTVVAYRALLGQDMDAGYASELADVSGRATLADVLVDVDDGGRLLGGVTYIPGPGPMAWFDDAGDACVDRAAAAGKRRLLLHTTAPMTVAHRLYERAGFRRDPGRDHDIGGGVFLLAYVLDLDGMVVITCPGGGTG